MISRLPGEWIYGLGFLLVILIVLAMIALGYKLGVSKAPAAPPVFHAAGPTVQDLQELSQLIILRVQVSDVLEGEHPLGAHIAVLVRGDCDLAVDLERANLDRCDTVRKSAVFILPQPTALRPRVDHERTRIYKAERTTWMPWRDPRDVLYVAAMKEAQLLVDAACGTPDQKQRARQHAELVITTFYRRLGWDVSVQWQME